MKDPRLYELTFCVDQSQNRLYWILGPSLDSDGVMPRHYVSESIEHEEGAADWLKLRHEVPDIFDSNRTIWEDTMGSFVLAEPYNREELLRAHANAAAVAPGRTLKSRAVREMESFYSELLGEYWAWYERAGLLGEWPLEKSTRFDRSPIDERWKRRSHALVGLLLDGDRQFSSVGELYIDVAGTDGLQNAAAGNTMRTYLARHFKTRFDLKLPSTIADWEKWAIERRRED